MGFDRYKTLKEENQSRQMPFLVLNVNETDKYEKYSSLLSSKRLDSLADKYYNDPTLWFLILMANEGFKNEHEIPDGYVLRIPFPKEKVLQEYEEKIRFYLNT